MGNNFPGVDCKEKSNVDGYLSRDLLYPKFLPLRDEAFDTDCLNPLRILKMITVGLKMVLVMLSRISTCCKNFQILIFSPLKMKSLRLLSKFYGYTFNGFGQTAT